MKKNIAVFLIVFSLFASASIALQPSITPFFRVLFSGVSAFIPSSASSVIPAAHIGSGDVNNDGKTDFLDLWIVSQGWDTKDETLDEYGDGKTNALDGAVVMNNMK